MQRNQVPRWFGLSGWESLSRPQQQVVEALCLSTVGGKVVSNFSQFLDFAGLPDRTRLSREGVAHYLGLRGYEHDEEKARKCWEAAASAYEPNAPHFLGIYHRSRGEEERAVEWFARGAALGNCESMVESGREKLRRGDVAGARALFESGAKEKHKASRMEQGRLFFSLGEWGEASKALREAGEGGEEEAELLMGKLYFWGRGVERDARAAGRMLEKFRGDGEAMWMVGMARLESGEPKKAGKWMEISAKLGWPTGQWRWGMGVLAGQFRGESDQAEEMLRKAADGGCEAAKRYWQHGKEKALEEMVKEESKKKKKCSRCRKEVESMLRCGRCKAVSYCSAQCQKDDWPLHKMVCVVVDKK